jgi:hypothetical protein
LLSAEPHWANREASGEASYGRSLFNFFRTYDPATGRYLEADPIASTLLRLSPLSGVQRDARTESLALTLKESIQLDTNRANPYTYALQDPIYWTDPRGLWSATGEGYFPPGLPGLGGLGLRIGFGFSSCNQFFLSIGGGVGFGATATYDPNGEPPGCHEGCPNSEPGFNLSLIGSASLGFGPAGVGAEKHLGAGANGPGGFRTFNESIPPGPSPGLGRFKLGGSASATVNMTFIGRGTRP